VDFDYANGFKGLPPQWQAILKGNFGREEIAQHPQEVINILHLSQQNFQTTEKPVETLKHRSAPVPAITVWKPAIIKRTPRRNEVPPIETIEEESTCTTNTSVEEFLMDIDYDDLPPIPDTPDIQEGNYPISFNFNF
jgi:hypothetical protein